MKHREREGNQEDEKRNENYLNVDWFHLCMFIILLLTGWGNCRT